MRVPSEIEDDYWIYAHSTATNNGSDYIGKWMLFIPVDRIDETWEKIKAATESDQLGIAAKTATMRGNRHALSEKAKLICVYTYDCRILDDVTKVLGYLREMGFKGRLNYKEDNATRMQLYGKGASLYTSPSGLTVKTLRRFIEPVSKPDP